MPILDRAAGLYRRLILDHPLVVLSGLLLIVAFFAWQSRDFQLDASADALMLESDEDLRLFREISRRYESRELLFVTFTPDEDLFSDASLTRIAQLRDGLRRVDGVDSLTTLVDVPLLGMVEGGLSHAADQYKTLADEDVDRQAASKELLESPIYRDLIISGDARTTALAVYLESNPEFLSLQNRRQKLRTLRRESGLPAEKRSELVRIERRYDEFLQQLQVENHRTISEIRDIVADYRQYGELHIGGVPMIADDMIRFVRGDLIIFGAGVAVFLTIMLSLIFRQARWVALPLLCCGCSVLIMTGFLGLVGWDVTVISSNFISLMLILTMSMNIHLVVRYRELVRDESDKTQPVLVFKTARRMVWPCLYTALTTMIGFASLFISDIKPVIDFGWMMTIGLAVSFLITFLLFPCLLVLLDKLAPAAGGINQRTFTSFMARMTDRHGSKVWLVSLAVALIGVFGMTQLKVENSFVNYFSKDTEIYQGQTLIDRKLGGTTPMDVILKFDSALPDEPGDTGDELDAIFGDIETSKADSWFTPEKIDLIKGVHDYLDGLEAVGKVLSLASTIRVAEGLMDGQEFSTFEMAILYKRLPEDLKESMLEPYISLDADEARITLRIRDSMEDLRRDALLKRIHSDLKEKFGLSEEEFQVTGLLVLYNNMLQSLFKSQILTLGVVMAGIALMLLVLFRSLSLAVIGIVPNILAAGAILGLMGVAGIPLDMMTITIAAITIGIAVDDCIHYIYRFREELPRHDGDYRATLYYCHDNIGKAMFYTSITIIIGFSILVTSNFIPTIYFGLLTALAMFLALLAALTLLPRLILWWKPF